MVLLVLPRSWGREQLFTIHYLLSFALLNDRSCSRVIPIQKKKYTETTWVIITERGNQVVDFIMMIKSWDGMLLFDSTDPVSQLKLCKVAKQDGFLTVTGIYFFPN